MRLIDADALKKDYPEDEDWEYPVNTNKYVVESIDRQPTVNAIPVEWITKYVNASGTSSIEQDIIREMVLAWIFERTYGDKG